MITSRPKGWLSRSISPTLRSARKRPSTTNRANCKPRTQIRQWSQSVWSWTGEEDSTGGGILQRGHNRYQKVLDLILCTAHCSDYINSWHVSEELSCSDHRHILYELSDLVLLTISDRNPRVTNWEGCVESLSRTSEDGPAPTKEIEHMDRAVEGEWCHPTYREIC